LWFFPTHHFLFDTLSGRAFRIPIFNQLTIASKGTISPKKNFNSKMTHRNHTMVSLLVFIFACCAGVALGDETETTTNPTLPSTYRDDLYHCADPTDAKYVIPCDPTTFRWRLDDLYPSIQPDDSLLCQEVVKILVRAKEQEQLDTGQLQAEQTQKDVQLWETIMETSVVDRLEPCVLWAMSYGPLAPWAASMGFDEQDHKFESGQHEHVDINDNSGESRNAPSKRIII
jgi:hypothetical protein